jgi:hypothetical protein
LENCAPLICGVLQLKSIVAPGDPGEPLKRQSGAPSRVITIPGMGDHHQLEFVITISWND